MSVAPDAADAAPRRAALAGAPPAVAALFGLLASDPRAALGRVLEVSREPRFLAYPDAQGQTLLHVAAGAGNLDVADFLLREQVLAVDVPDKHGYSPLHTAAAGGQLLMTHLLLAFGADLFHTTHGGQTVLHTAAAAGQATMLSYLLACAASSADAKFPAPPPAESWTQTPLPLFARSITDPRLQALRAVELSAEVSEEILSDLAATFASPPFVPRRAADLSLGQLLFRDVRDEKLQTALHIAAMHGQKHAVITLLGLGADPVVFDASHSSPLKWMVVTLPNEAEQVLRDLSIENLRTRQTIHYVDLLESEGSSSLLEDMLYMDRKKLVQTPVVQALIACKWSHFGNRAANWKIMSYLLFLALLTASAFLAVEGTRLQYHGKIWRVIIDAAAMLLFVVTALQEFWLWRKIVGRFRKWKKQWGAPAMDDVLPSLPLIMPPFPRNISRRHFFFALGGWGFIFFMECAFLLASGVSHIVGLAGDSEESPALSELVHARTLTAGLIFAWVYLLSFFRASERVGKLVFQLGLLVQATSAFLLVYLCLLVPFTAAFYVQFGATVDPFSSIGQSFMSLFRMTVANFDFSVLLDADAVMSSVLVAAWLFTALFVLLNFLAALMVVKMWHSAGGISAAVAMHRATRVLAAEVSLQPSSREFYHARLARPLIKTCGSAFSEDDNLGWRQDYSKLMTGLARNRQRTETLARDLHECVATLRILVDRLPSAMPGACGSVSERPESERVAPAVASQEPLADPVPARQHRPKPRVGQVFPPTTLPQLRGGPPTDSRV